MSPTTPEQAVLNEQRWLEWMEKGKRQDRAAARKIKVAAAIVLPLVCLGIMFYLFVNRV